MGTNPFQQAQAQEYQQFREGKQPTYILFSTNLIHTYKKNISNDTID